LAIQETGGSLPDPVERTRTGLLERVSDLRLIVAARSAHEHDPRS
jgi:hypothetical protein